MAEIHVLQPNLTLDRACRPSCDLTATIEAGIDLGPRGPQIRAVGACLEIMVTALRGQLTMLGVSDDVDEALAALERLARLARIYEAD